MINNELFFHQPLSHRWVFNSVMDPRLRSERFFSWNLTKKNIRRLQMKYFYHIDNRDTGASRKREGGEGEGVSIGVPCSPDPLKNSPSPPLFLPKGSTVPCIFWSKFP